MKITRLKSGYAIRLSDSEFEAMEALVTMGQSDLEGEDMKMYPYSPAVKRALGQSGRFGRRDAMGVDEDRRA